MDSRIREALKIGYLSSVESGDQSAASTIWDAMAFADLAEAQALLTAEPEPCEDMDEIIDSARLSASNTDTYPLISAYASQVADKRAETLRAENERLTRELENAQENVQCADLTINNLRVWVETLREALTRLLAASRKYHLKTNPIKLGIALHNYQDAECCSVCKAFAEADRAIVSVALAATETKPSKEPI